MRQAPKDACAQHLAEKAALGLVVLWAAEAWAHIKLDRGLDDIAGLLGVERGMKDVEVEVHEGADEIKQQLVAIDTQDGDEPILSGRRVGDLDDWLQTKRRLQQGPMNYADGARCKLALSHKQMTHCDFAHAARPLTCVTTLAKPDIRKQRG